MSALPSSIRIGRRLRHTRVTAGLTLVEIAAHLGVTYQQVQKYESGANRIPVDALVVWSVRTGATINDLLDEEIRHAAR